MYKFKFADIGEGLHEGVVAEIYKKEGEMVNEGDALFSVETDKVTSDIPSPATGKIIKVLMKEQDTIHVGQEIYYIEDENIAKSLSEEVKTQKSGGGGASVVGEVTVSDEVISFGSRKSLSKNSVKITEKQVNQNFIDFKNLSPAERRKAARAKVLGTLNEATTVISRRQAAREKLLNNSKDTINLATPINEKQIDQSFQKKATTSFDSSKEVKREKVTPIRKAIAKAMKNSWNNVAYTNLVHEINVTTLWDLRTKIKDSVLESTGIKLSFLPFITKAIIIALQDFPILISKYDEANSELVYPNSINMGIAVDTEAGLMVPVIKDAQNLSILEIASEINRLAKAARDKTIKPLEMKGSDFTITSYGSVGSLFGVPVINFPDMAIAGIGAISNEAIVTKNGIIPGKIMHLTIAADHRWVDGATIGRFATKVKKLLENPEVLGVY